MDGESGESTKADVVGAEKRQVRDRETGIRLTESNTQVESDPTIPRLHDTTGCQTG